jgi:penicillin-binding protein 1A
MRDDGVIGEKEYLEAVESKLSVIPRENRKDRFDSWFTEIAIDEVAKDLAKKYEITERAAMIMLLGGGYKIYTTMNPTVQSTLENYFENSKISELKDRLLNEKHFKAEDIAKNLRTYNDTFSMNWGEGLSYDRDALSFAKDKADAFKPSENKLLGVLEEAHRKFCEKGRVNNTAANETTVHKAPASVDGRVKIMINNDSLTEKETEKSQRIIHEQPTTNKSKNI